jgi:steroid 5-alpha reductase family enzyme
MRKTADLLDHLIRRGSLGAAILCVTAVVWFVTAALVAREVTLNDLLWTALFSFAAWAHFVVWKRRNRQKGIQLIGTEKELEALYPDER